MNQDKIVFFNRIAKKWDSWEDLEALAHRLDGELDALGVSPDECVLDVGCGTGNLTRALLEKLSAEGTVVAIDISPAMTDTARGKITDHRASWHVADVEQLPLADESIDRAVCYSVWPHIDDPRAAAAELYRVLRPGAPLHVWHLLSRERVNQIHAKAGAAVATDVLAPAGETARLLGDQGFEIRSTIDDEDRYLVTAVKPAATS